MKFDINRKHPFSSVVMIPEGEEDEYLSEEQATQFKKIALRCVRLTYLSVFFSVFAFACEFIDFYDIINASGMEKVLAIIGYVGFGCLILSLAFLFIEVSKLKKLSK